MSLALVAAAVSAIDRRGHGGGAVVSSARGAIDFPRFSLFRHRDRASGS